ncbi:MAG: hypothetical protein IJR60_00590 [Eubacterium sp.]|nr:hypothetical protein [Eubacterium sp.]
MNEPINVFKKSTGLNYRILNDVLSDSQFVREMSVYLNKAIDNELQKEDMDTVVIDESVQLLEMLDNFSH